ncbi:MAG: hypothetical protein ABIJ86_17065 [Spirochaetota bacterium]
MQIYQNPKFITVTYFEKPKHILFDWVKLAIPLEDLKTLHMKAYEVAVEKKVKTLIAETSKVTDVLFQECIEWFGKDHVPRLAAGGVSRIITVVPKTALGRLTTKSWQGAVQGIEIHEVATLDDAIKLVVE